MLAKREIALAAIEVCDLAMEVGGRAAFDHGSPIERAYRDVRAAKFHPLDPELTLVARRPSGARPAGRSSSGMGSVMQRSYRTDVVVVGARAAGAATAMLLARAGLDVIVVDRGREGTDTLSTHALIRGAVIQLNRWGLLDSIRAAGTPAVRRSTVHLVSGRHRDRHSTRTRNRRALRAPPHGARPPAGVDAARTAGATVRFRFHRSRAPPRRG